MNYYINTEFHEYHKQSKCLGIKIGKPIPTIDLISIGIVGEDIINKRAGLDGTKIPYMQRREYYAISKDFNIKDAWYSWQPKSYSLSNIYPIKEYWLRENVLKPIFRELLFIDGNNDNIVVPKYYRYPPNNKELNNMIINEIKDRVFTLKIFTKLINKYGKTNKQIAEEVKEFIYKDREIVTTRNCGKRVPINFYGYYADYDWVVFAQLFGKMIDLPKGFPVYCRDLKQMLDEKSENVNKACEVYRDIINTSDYLKQENEHNTLDNAKWNKELYNFLQTI